MLVEVLVDAIVHLCKAVVPYRGGSEADASRDGKLARRAAVAADVYGRPTSQN